MKRIIAIDQSTSSTKAMLFDEQCRLLKRSNVDHRQYYPKTGWVEHDAEEIYQNMIVAIRQLVGDRVSASLADSSGTIYSLAITNQRETAVVWNKQTGKPIANAVVWQDTRGAELCRQLRSDEATTKMVMEKSGLLIDPNFSASGVKWLLDNVPGARSQAQDGQLLMGTIDTWLIWKLTKGRSFYTDTTNASRTMLFNIHTMTWDDDLLELFQIPRNMLPEVLPCDAVYGETTVEDIFSEPISIAGVLGDSHGALVGQMCFAAGQGKVTYGTGSSVMVNIGESPLPAPQGLVTSVAFSAFGKHFYGYEGNIYSTGATLKWLADQMKMVNHPADIEAEATTVPDNGGVYIIPAFSGLGAPWWQSHVHGAVFGLTFATTRAHFLRASLESIAYQVKDLVDVMTRATGSALQEICADGGPTKNAFLMQFQADLLSTPVVCTEVEDASAMGAVIMNGFALKMWATIDEVIPLRKVTQNISPRESDYTIPLYNEWRHYVAQLIK
ncbi:MAG: glycerol kinase GlpK [Prevotella sp.]|nr:glycerol kinase GlpK [Prevotella sp.]